MTCTTDIRLTNAGEPADFLGRVSGVRDRGEVGCCGVAGWPLFSKKSFRGKLKRYG